MEEGVVSEMLRVCLLQGATNAMDVSTLFVQATSYIQHAAA